MEFRLLGHLDVRQAGATVAVRGPRQRAVLAALLLRANEPTSIGYLTAAVWETPPAAPESNIRTYVAELRRTLRSADEFRLTTRSDGYLMTVAPGELDVDSFGIHAGQGDRAVRSGDFTAGAQHLGRAVALWRGRPLTDQPLGPALQVEVARLEDLRLVVAVQYAQCRVELGQAEAAIGELRALLVEYPLREELWAQLMLALHRCGRQAEALDAFSQVRQRLVQELGIEPGARLQEVQREILTGDRVAPSATVVTTAPGGADTQVLASRQLPMDIAEFTGRQAELRRLHSMADDPGSPTAVQICAIQGMAGVGKTRLAVRAAHEIIGRGRFDEIQLWADLHGFDAEHSPTDPASVLQTFLRALGVPGREIPHDLEARAALYRDRLAGKRALILLDNAANTAQIRHLLPGHAGCLVLITSRLNLSTMDGVRPLPLEPLSQRDATALLARITDDGRIGAEPKAAARVVRLCGNLPIMVALAARRLRDRPLWTVAELAARLERAERPPGHGAVPGIFRLSYQALSTAQQRMFRLLGLHPGDDVTAESSAALNQTSPDEAEELLEALLDAHLVQQTTPGRYRFHDLIRQYAMDRAEADESELDRLAAVYRVLVWYLHAAEAARGVLDPHRRRIIALAAPQAWCIVPTFASYDDALAWCEAERVNLMAAVRTAAECGKREVAWKLPWVLLSFYYLRSLWDDWIAAYLWALDSARALGDRRDEGIIWRGLGVAQSDLRQFTRAIDSHHQAQVILEEVGDEHGQAWNLNNLGVVHVELDRLAEAEDCFQRALAMFRNTNDAQGEGICLNNLGDTYWRLGQPARAIAHLDQALTIQRDANDRAGLRFTLATLGDYHRHTGQHEQAVDRYRQALAAARLLSNERAVARAHASLAETLHLTGETSKAIEHWRAALTIFDELGDAQAGMIRTQLAN